MKKNFIIYTFIIFLLTSFTVFAEREVDFEKLKYDEKTGLVYLEGEKEAFTGIAKQYYEDKSLKIEFPYKNGKMEGRGKEYYPSGKFKSDAFFVDGLLQGKSTGYYENGNLEYEENYKDGKLDGLIKEYYENGQVFIQENYKDGKLDGESFNFNEDGSFRSKAVYKNGELVGDIIKGETGSVVAGDVPDTEEVTVPTNENIESKIAIFAFGTVIIGLIAYTIFKIFTAFPKTNHLTDEQRSRILKILMKYDEGKNGLFSAYRMNGVGTGYYKVRSMMVDNEKVYIYAKMFSILLNNARTLATLVVRPVLVSMNCTKILVSI